MDSNPVPIGCNVYHCKAETEIHHNIKQTINIVIHAILVVFYGHSSTLKSVIGIFWQHLYIERLRACMHVQFLALTFLYHILLNAIKPDHM